MLRLAAVIPNRNGFGFIGASVSAARAADIARVVVVDDHSSDGSAREAHDAGAQVVKARGRGFASAVSQGFDETVDPYVLVLNSDCFLDEDAPALLADALDSDDSLAIVAAGLREGDGRAAKSHGNSLTLWGAIRALATGRSGRAPTRIGAGVQSCEFVPLACALVRRSAWDAVGAIDTGYVFYFEDYDLCWRLREAGFSIAVCWDAGAVHVGGASSTKQDGNSWAVQYYASLGRYLRKRYPITQSLFGCVWLGYVIAQSVRRPRRAPQFLRSVKPVLFPRL